MDKTVWKGKSHIVQKPWGREIVWTAMLHVSGKILNITAGERTSLKYHNIKDEVLYMLSGNARIIHSDCNWDKDRDNIVLKESIFSPGDYFAIQSMCLYRIEAIDDCTIFEIGNSTRSNSCVRLEDDYGRAATSNRGENENRP